MAKVTGLPSPRPVCQACGKRLAYWATAGVFERLRGYPFKAPIFCTLRCALAFACMAYRMGTRADLSKAVK